ncbi:MAG: hypothetical protein IKE76_04180 [Clostridia bacterium]|nr:hypothetical protein [Clostridia bacterium]
MRGSGIAAAILLLAVASAGMIAGTADAEDPAAYVVTFYDAEKQQIGTATAWRWYGYIVPPEDIPPLPEGCGYYTQGDPGPDGWVDITACTWDSTEPVKFDTSVYIWDASHVSPDSPPYVPSSPEPDREGPGVGAMVCAGLIAAGLIGAAGWMFLRRD